MIDPEIQNYIQQQFTGAQYNVAKTPYHAHTGVDSPRIDAANIIGLHSSYGRSYLSNAQSIGTTFNTKITFDTNDYASGITWDGTNNRFTATTAGKYLVTSNLQWNSPTTNFSYETRIYKNTNEVSRGSMIPGSFAGPASSNVCDIVTLAVGDYVEIHAFQLSGGSINVAGGSALSFFSITQIV